MYLSLHYLYRLRFSIYKRLIRQDGRGVARRSGRSRGSRGKSYQDNLPPFRQMLSKLSHICNTWVLRIKIKDTQGGMKGFSQAGQAIFLTTRINSFLFDTEFIYKASRRKEINLQTINANIKEGLAVSNMGFKVLRREALNFLSILFHRD